MSHNPDETEPLPHLDWQSGLARVCKKLAAEGVVKVGLQLPEGLRGQASTIIDFIENRLHPSSIVTYWAEPTFGACDLADRPLAELGVETLIHLGHTTMPYHSSRHAIPVHFVPVEHTGGLTLNSDTIDHLKELLTGGTDEESPIIGLVTTAQHAHLLDSLQAELKAVKVRSLVGRGSRRLAFDGQILGCNFSAAWALDKQVSGYLYLGTGRFHPLTLALASQKPVAALDPHTGVIEQVNGERFLRQRHACLTKGQTASRWALLISPQIGQCRTGLADLIEKQLKTAGKTVYRVASTHQTAQQLSGLGVEAAVATSCPRLAIEDGPSWPMVLLTPPEMEMALSLREWDPDNYPFDEIL